MLELSVLWNVTNRTTLYGISDGIRKRSDAMPRTYPQEQMIPETPELGKLKVEEVLAYYDKPVFFTCRNENNIRFLCVLVDEEKDLTKWLLVDSIEDKLTEMELDEALRSAIALTSNIYLLAEKSNDSSAEVVELTKSQALQILSE